MTKLLISVVGTTAIGKTNLAIALAKYFNAEIISADSRQFYKEMTIGTAVPSKAELQMVKHHFIQHKSVKDTYSVGDFERDAITKIEALHKHNNVVVMVGGSGLYTNAVTKGLDYFPDIDAEVRQQLNTRLKTEGLAALQNQLQQLDAKAYQSIAIDNPHRVIRALEVCIGSGKPYSSYLKNEDKQRPFKTITIGLEAERVVIYNRINQRVDVMMVTGLVEEAKALLPYKNYNALNTVGYKELFEHFEAKHDLDFAINEIKKNTRRFAKRQLTWYRKDQSINWFNYATNPKEIISFIKNTMDKG